MIDFNVDFNYSYAAVMKEKSKRFIDLFYTIFLDKSPKIKEAFKETHIENQKKMLAESIVHLVNFYSTKTASEFMQSLAVMHRDQLKISPDIYDLWLEALLEAVEGTDEECTEFKLLAWRITLAPGMEFMKHSELASS